MRKYFFLFIFCLFSFVCLSQKKAHLLTPFVELGGGPATGVSQMVYSMFADAGAGVTYRFSDKIDFNGNLRYVCFLRKKNKKGVSFLPLSAGINYKMVSKLFLEMQMGGALLIEDGSVYFLAEPGIGWKFNNHHSIRTSYLGFVTNGLAIGGIHLTYRYQF